MGGAWRREDKGESNEKERERGEEKEKLEEMGSRKEGRGGAKEKGR